MPTHSLRRLLVIAGLLAGCATVTVPAPTICLPPGVSLAGATAQMMESVILEGEVVGGWPAVMIMYAVARQPVKTIWLNGRLVAIDPDPLNPDAPLWLDGGIITTDGKVRAERGAPCQWHQPIQPTRREDRA